MSTQSIVRQEPQVKSCEWLKVAEQGMNKYTKNITLHRQLACMP